MSWSYKITLFLAFFIVSMMSMVYVAFKQSNEMMEDNYYDREMKYQDVINASHNLAKISTSPIVSTNGKDITVNIPKSLNTNFSNGKIQLIRNSDKTKDTTIEFKANAESTYSLNTNALAEGNYNARISWQNENENYYKEENIFISK